MNSYSEVNSLYLLKYSFNNSDISWAISVSDIRGIGNMTEWDHRTYELGVSPGLILKGNPSSVIEPEQILHHLSPVHLTAPCLG
jgi:hypothetical protein